MRGLPGLRPRPCAYGDGGGCPDAEGRFQCVLCFSTMPKGATSSICTDCRTSPRMQCEGYDCPGCGYCMREDEDRDLPDDWDDEPPEPMMDHPNIQRAF